MQLENNNTETQKCTKCLIIKPLLTDYYLTDKIKRKYRKQCKRCANIRSNEVEKERRKVDEEYRLKLIGKHKDYRKNLSISCRRNSILKKYGITVDEYNIIFIKQNGKCAICLAPQENFKKFLFVDHCHKTNVVRGLLCQKCNQGIGLLNDDKEIMIRAAEYVSKYERK